MLERFPQLIILLVDDGSTDRTQNLISGIATNQPRILTLFLPKNVGKAEAVRKGLLRLLNQDCDWVGYADADFSTPACEIIRLIEEISRGDKKVIMGSRIRRLGTKIHRSPLRHYLGRGFATFTSLVLKVPVYDTQCGAKLFQVGPPFREALAEPFLSAWIFDVEILGRLLTGSPGLVETDFMEVPLLQWNEVKGSRFSGLPMLYACLELAIIYLKLAGKRRALRKLLKLS